MLLRFSKNLFVLLIILFVKNFSYGNISNSLCIETFSNIIESQSPFETSDNNQFLNNNNLPIYKKRIATLNSQFSKWLVYRQSQIKTIGESNAYLNLNQFLSNSFDGISKYVIAPLFQRFDETPLPLVITPMLNKNRFPRLTTATDFIDQFFLSPLIYFLRPFPWVSNSLEKIYFKYEGLPPESKITQSETNYLNKHGKLNDFRSVQEGDFNNKPWLNLKKSIRKGFAILFLTSNILTAQHMIQLAEHPISPESAITLLENNVEDRIYLIRMGHLNSQLSLSIDGKLYSYSKGQLETESVHNYLNQISNPNGNLSNVDLFQSEIFTINIDKENKESLIRTLESQSLMTYKNIPFINDSSRLTAHLINQFTEIKIPTFLDVDSSQIQLYLSELNTLGVKNKKGELLILAVNSIVPEKLSLSSETIHNAYAAYIGQLRLNLAIDGAILTSLGRSYFDASEPENLTPHSSKKIIETLRKNESEGQSLIINNSQIHTLTQALSKLKTSDPLYDKGRSLLEKSLLAQEHKVQIEIASGDLSELRKATLNGMQEAIGQLRIKYKINNY